jgi:hypothetical protein
VPFNSFTSRASTNLPKSANISGDIARYTSIYLSAKIEFQVPQDKYIVDNRVIDTVRGERDITDRNVVGVSKSDFCDIGRESVLKARSGGGARKSFCPIPVSK